MRGDPRSRPRRPGRADLDCQSSPPGDAGRTSVLHLFVRSAGRPGNVEPGGTAGVPVCRPGAMAGSSLPGQVRSRHPARPRGAVLDARAQRWVGRRGGPDGPRVPRCSPPGHRRGVPTGSTWSSAEPLAEGPLALAQRASGWAAHPTVRTATQILRDCRPVRLPTSPRTRDERFIARSPATTGHVFTGARARPRPQASPARRGQAAASAAGSPGQASSQRGGRVRSLGSPHSSQNASQRMRSAPGHSSSSTSACGIGTPSAVVRSRARSR